MRLRKITAAALLGDAANSKHPAQKVLGAHHTTVRRSSLVDSQGASLIVVDPDDGVWSPVDGSRGLAAVALLRERFPQAAGWPLDR